jgi:hypothetical protein
LKLKRDTQTLTDTEGNPSFGHVVGGHFHFDTVSNNESNEALAHLAGNMSENLEFRSIV